MDGRFDPRLKSIIIPGTLGGPAAEFRVRLALDTGATRSVLRPSILRAAGFDLSRVVGHTKMTTASGEVSAPLIEVPVLRALNRTRGLTVAAHEFPSRFQPHGLLGRDFFAGLLLTIDFSKHVVTLRPPRWWAFWR